MEQEVFKFYDLRRKTLSENIDLLFPDWQRGEERVAILSPHDDDGVLGAGYVTLASIANGADVYLFIFCDGRGGYSQESQKDTIVELRKKETLEAYNLLGLKEEHIIRFDFPDFSLGQYTYWLLPSGGEGAMPQVIQRLRELKITRLLIPNGYREHLDHEAASKTGFYGAPTAGDAVLVDRGKPWRIKSYLVYSVWGDFSPEDALVHGEANCPRANRAIKASFAVEKRIRQALDKFASQAEIIKDLVALRKLREREESSIEVYLDVDPRPPLNYRPYWDFLTEMFLGRGCRRRT
ncbi:PIG-L family deacetylase [Acidobacteria bacterium AH-259-O06]|nr:PIG-L family deacetylase [Acidobacteria bacterium AH-259-O06]